MDKKEFALKQHESGRVNWKLPAAQSKKLPRIWLLPILRALQNPGLKISEDHGSLL